jgi:pimeloyl-ACP methyl ester carboxylesterase
VDLEADDAAALLRALDLAPALLWGNSSGAIIGLSLALRHPEVVRKAMLHELPLLAGLSDPDGVLDFLKEVTANGKVPFMRMLTGDAVYDGFSEEYRTRLEADETWIRYELPTFPHYRPTDQDLAQVQKPVAVLYGSDSPPFLGRQPTGCRDAWVSSL